MKWPTMDEFAQMVADKAIDEIEYKGKTLRQWIEIILATDINVATKDGTNLAEVGVDCISRQAAIDAIRKLPVLILPGGVLLGDVLETIRQLPSAQPERTCVNCGRTANNGGWYADGRTRCPIEEHYALPKDGFCHLWEKRNITDDDYPERREE